MRLSRLLLTGASLLTLSIAGVARATAAGVTITKPGHLPYTVPADQDWINVDASDITTFTNNKNIADGFSNPDGADPLDGSALALHIRSNSGISSLINGVAGNISAIEAAFGSSANNASTSHATATALLSEGILKSATNSGIIR